MGGSISYQRPSTKRGEAHSAQLSVKELAADITAWPAAWNENPTPFMWHKTAEQLLERLAAYCAAINEDATA